ncbi:hypothetical protein [Desulfobulbus propionicus]|uniref:hypothetical protein n=1 Tax=Desulfobulbus propionicus TaxID=894 RepID=UPI001FE02594|nr:hypothetical protein [Desulfobulbus propionicus]
MLHDTVQAIVIDIAKKGKIAQEVEHPAHLVIDRPYFLFAAGVAEMFNPERAGAAAAGNHAIRDLVRSFIFDDDFCQVRVENFACPPVRGGMHHGGADEGTLSVAFHANGDAG